MNLAATAALGRFCSQPSFFSILLKNITLPPSVSILKPILSNDSSLTLLKMFLSFKNIIGTEPAIEVISP